MAVVCKWERWRGQLAASLPSSYSWAAALLPQTGARAVHPAAVGSALRALSGPGERFPRARRGRPSSPAGGRPTVRVLVRLSLPGCPVRAASGDRRAAGISAVSWSGEGVRSEANATGAICHSPL